MEPDSVSVSTLSDGTVIYKDATGEPAYGMDILGNVFNVPGPSGSPLVQQFANLLDFWGRSTIEQRNRAQALQERITLAQLTPAGAVGASLANMMPLLLIAGAGFIAYKALAK